VALYATTLLISLVVVAGGVSLVTLQMAGRRLQDNIETGEQSFLLTRSGLEWALAYIDTEPNWRSVMTSGAATTLEIPDAGSLTVVISDDDGDLADCDTDPVTISVAADVSGARRGIELTAGPAPHPVLSYAVFADTSIRLKHAIMHGPAYARDTILADRYIDTEDNGSFSVPSGGWIDWWLEPQDEDAESVDKPAIDVNYFVGLGTLVLVGTVDNDVLKRVNLTPTDNTQGTPNALGIYYADIGNRDLEIKDLHVKGTLIVRGSGGNKVELKKGCWFEPAGYGYPALIIDVPGGKVHFMMDRTLNEDTDLPVDFNEDGDMVDVIGSSVSGLVWTEADETIIKGNGWQFTGCLIGDYVEVDDDIVLDDDPGLAVQLIPQFTDGKLHVSEGSIRETTP